MLNAQFIGLIGLFKYGQICTLNEKLQPNLANNDNDHNHDHDNNGLFA